MEGKVKQGTKGALNEDICQLTDDDIDSCLVSSEMGTSSSSKAFSAAVGSEEERRGTIGSSRMRRVQWGTSLPTALSKSIGALPLPREQRDERPQPDHIISFGTLCTRERQGGTILTLIETYAASSNTRLQREQVRDCECPQPEHVISFGTLCTRERQGGTILTLIETYAASSNTRLQREQRDERPQPDHIISFGTLCTRERQGATTTGPYHLLRYALHARKTRGYNTHFDRDIRGELKYETTTRTSARLRVPQPDHIISFGTLCTRERQGGTILTLMRHTRRAQIRDYNENKGMSDHNRNMSSPSVRFAREKDKGRHTRRAQIRDYNENKCETVSARNRTISSPSRHTRRAQIRDYNENKCETVSARNRNMSLPKML
ncbi:hypothetical protein J6590_005014 [Homalodisca vitripennis]|nr:hypothetical protein J6590_005014 [Homalodisca vitripennis]